MDKKRFYILTNHRKDPEDVFTDKIVAHIESRGMEAVKNSKNPNLEGSRYLYNNPVDVPDDIDCIITLGGDGTVLQASRDFHSLKIPMLGINIGTLGFLTDADKETAFDAIDAYIEGDYVLDKRMMLYGEIIRDGHKVYENFALNDAVISRSGSLRVIDFDLSVNHEFLNSYIADGVIISTATGSTAYSMSAGGPIIQPDAKLLMVTPICPHAISSKSIILDPDDEIMVEISDKKNLKEEREITFDGETSFSLLTGDKIYIRQFPETAIFIKTKKTSFLQRVRENFNQRF